MSLKREKPKRQWLGEKAMGLAIGAMLKIDKMEPGAEHEGDYRHPTDFPSARRTDLEIEAHDIKPEEKLPGLFEPRNPNEYRPRMR